MSAPLPLNQSCCAVCNAPVSTQGPPGPPGQNGPPGINGTDGVDAFTLVTTQFTQPASGNFVTISVANSMWMTPGQNLFIQNGGYYAVVNTPNSLSVTLQNLGYTGNSIAGSTIAVNSKISPGGIKGTDGTTPVTPLTAVFLTTGDPNGVITATRPAIAYDASTLNMWFKTDVGSSNTGWTPLIAGP